MSWKSFKTKFNYLVWELVLTLSHGKSLLSSKRLERFALFSTAIVMCITYFVMHLETITVTEMLGIVGVLLGYAGFTMTKTEKDKLPTPPKDEEIN